MLHNRGAVWSLPDLAPWSNYCTSWSKIGTATIENRGPMRKESCCPTLREGAVNRTVNDCQDLLFIRQTEPV